MKKSILLLALVAGCAVFESRTAADAGKMLLEAGFQREPLHEASLPALLLIEQAGHYKFADPGFCHCVYVGGASEYAALRRLRAQRIGELDLVEAAGVGR